MKTKKLVLPSVLIGLSLLMWNCSSSEQNAATDQASLKTSIQTNAQTLSVAMNTIANSSAYQVLSNSGVSADFVTSSASKVAASKPDTTVNTISLADIAGIYDYKAVAVKRNHMSFTRFFTKTGESSNMIVRLPEEEVKNYGKLLRFMPGDTALANDYVVTVSNYNYSFNRYMGYDYAMSSNINIKSVDAGNLSISSSDKREAGYQFSSEYTFPNGYTAKCSTTTGDTAISTYTILQGSTTLYQEKYTAIKSSTTGHMREKEYSLTIGNVEIVRKAGKNSLDSAKVYVSGVLQTNSKVEIVDTSSDSTEVSVTNHNREIKVTFDDGTSATISQLLGNSVTTIRSLFDSLRKAYFATGVVDWIAWDIYTKKNY